MTKFAVCPQSQTCHQHVSFLFTFSLHSFTVKNTFIRSRIKDRTIDQLKRDLEDQYYRQNSNEEVLRLQRELEDAKEFLYFKNLYHSAVHIPRCHPNSLAYENSSKECHIDV